MAPSSLLLDSHVFVWALEQTQKIGRRATEQITGASTVYVSVISLWELEIKHKAGKFPYTTAKLVEGLEQSGFTLLALAPEHIEAYGRVHLAHNDPFDTLLVAQSEAAGCQFVTADKQILNGHRVALDAAK
jgi:PIN domain nuclease of toxin-antitoxin system